MLAFVGRMPLKDYRTARKVNKVLGIETIPCHTISSKAIILKLHLQSFLSIDIPIMK